MPVACNGGLAWRLHRWADRDVDMVMVSADDAVVQFRDEFGFGDKVVVQAAMRRVSPCLLRASTPRGQTGLHLSFRQPHDGT